MALLSYQDTWITTSTQKNRHYIKNSLIEGAVDFIYNGGDVYLDGDTLEINRPSGGYIVAPWHTADTKWGYVFQNNVIRQHPGVNVTDVCGWDALARRAQDRVHQHQDLRQHTG